MAVSIPPAKDNQSIDEEGPYIGPRPFGMSPEHQKRFFGRDSETDDILSLVLAHNIILVYAQSGAGKTSIFNARILPTLEKRGFEILPTTRVKITSSIPTESYSSGRNITTIIRSNRSNIYMFNAFHSIKPEVDPRSVVNQSLTQFLGEYFPLKKDKRGRNRPQIIIFDQFEELFALQAKDYHNQQQEFFEQIVEALDNNPVLRVVFVIREEYIARLDPFTRILPDRVRYRCRLERLKENNALMAVKTPLIELGLYSKELEDDIKDIIMNLEDEGEFVEPIHLQVVCQRWWQQRSSTEVSKDKIADVDKALEDFYVNAVHDAAQQTNINEKDIREWCEHELITSSETRGIVHQSTNSTQGMSNKVVEILDKKYLIRPELRSGGGVWYELTHDGLIKPIKNSNLKWNEKGRTRKSRRNRVIIIPSIVAIIAAVSIGLVILFGPHVESKSLLLGQTPSYLSVNPNTNMVYVAGSNATSGTGSISVIDGTTNKVVHDIKLGKKLSDVVINQNANIIFVLGTDSASRSGSIITVINGTTNKVIGDILLAHLGSSEAIAVNPETNMIYEVSKSSEAIYAINGTSNQILTK